eukprot:3863325-Pleurochrysis_carterae.AAC.5
MGELRSRCSLSLLTGRHEARGGMRPRSTRQNVPFSECFHAPLMVYRVVFGAASTRSSSSPAPTS